MDLETIYNEDCLETMSKMDERSVDVVLTSPPYNTSRKSATNLDNHEARYEEYGDCLTDEEYTEWSIKIFEGFDKVLKPNGCVLYNMSYSSENTWLLWNLVAALQQRTNFVVADCIVWKKKSALPNNTSSNKLTRICEFVFVFCRKDEFATFNCYKGESSTRTTGQTMYANVFNYVDAPNNDYSCPIHKATYSTILCRKLLGVYSKEGDVVYDPFMGVGTTAIACVRDKRRWIGSEISERYCKWAENRIKIESSQLRLF